MVAALASVVLAAGARVVAVLASAALASAALASILVARITGSYFKFGPSSVLGPRAADDALLLRLQRTGVRSSRRGQVGGLDQQKR